MEEPFRTYHRNLPHWRARGRPYFVTWRLHRSQLPLNEDERTLVVQAIRHFEGSRYELSAYVIMDDHVHVLISPSDEYTLEQIIHSWKSFTSHEILKNGTRTAPLWQDESFDRLPRTENELYQTMEYIYNNPKERWPETENYPWVWIQGFDKQ